MTVAVDGDVIVDAYIDEFRIMDSTLTDTYGYVAGLVEAAKTVK